MYKTDNDGLEIRNDGNYCHCRFCKKFDKLDGNKLPNKWRFITKLHFAGGYCYYVCGNCYDPQRDFKTL